MATTGRSGTRSGEPRATKLDPKRVSPGLPRGLTVTFELPSGVAGSLALLKIPIAPFLFRCHALPALLQGNRVNDQKELNAKTPRRQGSERTDGCSDVAGFCPASEPPTGDQPYILASWR